MYLHLSLYLYIYLRLSISISIFINLSLYLPSSISISISISIFIYLYIYISISIYLHLYIYLSSTISRSTFTYLSIFLCNTYLDRQSYLSIFMSILKHKVHTHSHTREYAFTSISSTSLFLPFAPVSINPYSYIWQYTSLPSWLRLC